MNAKQKILLTPLMVVAGLGLLTPKAEACYMYGNGEPSRQIIVDKQVKPDRWNDWKDNLSADAYLFQSDDRVDFKVRVKNTGEDDLDNVEVIDYLPDYVDYVSGPGGATRDGNQVKWNAGHFNPGEEKEYTLQVEIVESNLLEGKGNFCVVNRVRVEAESDESDEDTSEFCIEGTEGKVLGVKLPETGASLALGMIASLTVAGAGTFIKRKNQ